MSNRLAIPALLSRINLSAIVLLVAIIALAYNFTTAATPCANAAQCNVGDDETFTNAVTFEGEINVGATPGPGSAGAVLTSGGADTTPRWGIAAHKAASQSTSTDTTLNDDNDLSVSVNAATDYELTGILFVTSSTTPGFKFNWTIPGSGTVDGDLICPQFCTGDHVYFTEAADENVIISGSSVQAMLTLHGVVKSDTAGTFALKWAQITSDAASTSVDSGSYIHLKPLN